MAAPAAPPLPDEHPARAVSTPVESQHSLRKFAD